MSGLIINADDLGYSSTVNRAIVDMFMGRTGDQRQPAGQPARQRRRGSHRLRSAPTFGGRASQSEPRAADSAGQSDAQPGGRAGPVLGVGGFLSPGYVGPGEMVRGRGRAGGAGAVGFAARPTLHNGICTCISTPCRPRWRIIEQGQPASCGGLVLHVLSLCSTPTWLWTDALATPIKPYRPGRLLTPDSSAVAASVGRSALVGQAGCAAAEQAGRGGRGTGGASLATSTTTRRRPATSSSPCSARWRSICSPASAFGIG